MDAEPGSRPWWRTRRWRLAAGAAWLLAAVYPVGLFPAAYCVGRGWADEDAVLSAYAPVTAASRAVADAARPSAAVYQLTAPGGRVVTREVEREVSWPVRAAASLADGYWRGVGACADAGERDRG